jgi:outer membrane protein assembly factor BamE (lipoprotein component of BamABCDE complex)
VLANRLVFGKGFGHRVHMSVRRDSTVNSARRGFIWLGAAAAASLVAGCQPTINRRGYYAKPGALSQVSEGMAKSEVEAIMGSPSTTASINFQGDSYYYISSVTSRNSFFPEKEQSREIIAIRFSREDQVESVAQYTLEDGRIINLLDRQTPVAGQEFKLLSELFRTTGAGPSGSMLNRGQ